jgi:hypothetical protein
MTVKINAVYLQKQTMEKLENSHEGAPCFNLDSNVIIFEVNKLYYYHALTKHMLNRSM